MRSTLLIALSVAMLGSFSCSTYTSDLDRAEKHFQAQQYANALALFRVLEPDIDSYNPANRARYAYFRGMNDYRLSGQKPGVFVNENTTPTAVESAYRRNARYWIGVAQALEQETPGSLRPEWKDDAASAMRDLNQDIFGIGVFVDDSTSKPPQPPVPASTDTESSSESGAGI